MNKLSPTAQVKVRTILAMMQRGMSYEEAYATLWEQQPANSAYPRDQSQEAIARRRQSDTNRLEIAIVENPGQTRRELMAVTGLSADKIHRSLQRLRERGRTHCIRSASNIGRHYPGPKA